MRIFEITDGNYAIISMYPVDMSQWRVDIIRANNTLRNLKWCSRPLILLGIYSAKRFEPSCKYFLEDVWELPDKDIEDARLLAKEFLYLLQDAQDLLLSKR